MRTPGLLLTLVCSGARVLDLEAPAYAASEPPPQLDVFAEARDGYVEVIGDGAGLNNGAPVADSTSPVPLTQRIRAAVCLWGLSGTGEQLPCPGDRVVQLEECGDAATLPPLWQRTRPAESSTWGPWQLVGPPVCAAPATVTPDMVLTELRRLPLRPSTLVMQPDRGWVLVNKPTVVSSDATPQTLTTTILGTRVTITASPQLYAWDFGDGETLVTRDPGDPWPDADLSHTYTRTGGYRITLTTTWSATYTLAGDPTVRDVPGTAATTVATGQFAVEERRTHLVAGTCADDEAAPGC